MAGEPNINALGVINRPHGVCGFVACFQAYFDSASDTWKKTMMDCAVGEKNVAGIIVAFLRRAQEKRPEVIGEIDLFTRSFGGKYKDFSCKKYIKAAHKPGASLDIAMPPSGVLRMLRDGLGMNSAALVDVDTPLERCIVGVTEPGHEEGLHDGLRHWVYYSAGTVYSWGRTFNGGDLAEALADLKERGRGDFTVCQKIKL